MKELLRLESWGCSETVDYVVWVCWWLLKIHGKQLIGVKKDSGVRSTKMIYLYMMILLSIVPFKFNNSNINGTLSNDWTY